MLQTHIRKIKKNCMFSKYSGELVIGFLRRLTKLKFNKTKDRHKIVLNGPFFSIQANISKGGYQKLGI